MKLKIRGFQIYSLKGLTNESFRNLFIQPKADYVDGKGYEISQAMIKLKLGGKAYDLNKFKKSNVKPFNPNDERSLEETFAHFLIETSMKLSLCCVISYENDLIPFTEHPTLEKLMALRYRRMIEKGASESQPNAELIYLSERVFRQIIPNELIERAPFEKIVEFRKNMREMYLSFRKYLMKLNLIIESETWDEKHEKEFDSILIKEVIPAVDEFQKESQRIWEKMFGKIAKKVIEAGSITGLSSFLLSLFTGYSWIDLFVKGCGLATPIVVPNLIDYALEKEILNVRTRLAI